MYWKPAPLYFLNPPITHTAITMCYISVRTSFVTAEVSREWQASCNKTFSMLTKTIQHFSFEPNGNKYDVSWVQTSCPNVVGATYDGSFKIRVSTRRALEAEGVGWLMLKGGWREESCSCSLQQGDKSHYPKQCRRPWQLQHFTKVNKRLNSIMVQQVFAL